MNGNITIPQPLFHGLDRIHVQTNLNSLLQDFIFPQNNIYISEIWYILHKVIWARKKLGLMGEDGTQVGQLESWNLFVASFLYTSGATRCLILI